MRVSGDRKRGLIITPEDREDLWKLSILIVKGDKVRGRVERRTKEEGKTRIHIFTATLNVEETEFTGSSLRIKGRILEAPEDIVGKGKYQTLEVREGTTFTLFMDPWRVFVEEELKRERPIGIKILLGVIDDEEGCFGVYDRRITFLGCVRRGEEELEGLYGKVLAFIRERDEEIVVIGGPKVILSSFQKFIDEKDVDKKVYYVITPLKGEKGLRDIATKRAALIIKDGKRAIVEEKINEFVMHLAKGDKLASLDPKKDVLEGNVDVLLVHEGWIEENREEAARIMEEAHNVGAKIYIVQKDYEGEAIVRKLGGKIAIRRYSP